MFANDPSWLTRLRGRSAQASPPRRRWSAIRRRTPGAAERDVRRSICASAAHDLEDLANRLLRHLAGLAEGGRGAAARQRRAGRPRELAPAELLDYGRAKLKAVVLEEGSPPATSPSSRGPRHSLVGRIDNLSTRRQRRSIIVDGERGEAICARPPTSSPLSRQTARGVGATGWEEFAAVRTFPAETADGVATWHSTSMPGLRVDLPHLDETGAAGIGPFRTELPVHGSRTAAAACASQTDLCAGCSMPPGYGRSRSARSTSAATRCCRTWRRSAEKPPWAGAQFASASIARRCCAIAPRISRSGGRAQSQRDVQ